MKKKYYGAYGSNLNIEQMAQRCPGATIVGKVVLKNYRLLFKGEVHTDNFKIDVDEEREAFLTIEPNEHFHVPLGIWLVDDEHEKSLDEYEFYPEFYIKETFDLEINGKIESVFIYIMTEKAILSLPSQRYIDKCLQGYNDFQFDTQLLFDALDYSKHNL